MKFAVAVAGRVAGLLVASSATLLGGCASYDGYGGGYPSAYDDPAYGYYGGPQGVQPGAVVIGGGYYYGGPGPRGCWDDGPGWGRGYPPGGYGYRRPSGGGDRGGPPPQATGGVRPGRPAAPPSAGGGNGQPSHESGSRGRGYYGPQGN